MKERESLFDARDLDVIAVAVQNTVNDDNRLDALAALRRVRAAMQPDVEGRVPSSWYLAAKERADAAGDVMAAARSVVGRWREIRRADDEIALLDAALSRVGKA